MYNLKSFRHDLIAGVTVALVALPMALAFGYASGVGAAAGLYSAIAAGIVASLFGGSKFQITGPTGGMIAVLVLVVSKYGVEKALLAGLMAGVFQIIFGYVKLGKLIKYIPFSVVTGFTAGIAFVIILSQKAIITKAPIIVIITVVLSFVIRRLWPKIPVSLITVIAVTVIVELLHIPTPRLGAIPATLPLPSLPAFSLNSIRELFKPALILASLGSIESLLSAVVADGMTPDEHHDSNRELIGQGLGNIVAPLFGGIAATGAIARTAVNIKAGASTRISGVIHSLTILALMIFLSPLVSRIPLAVLAGVLVVAAIRMIEWDNIVLLYKSSRDALAVMGLTLAVTVFVDLVTAVEVGLIASGILFIYRMSNLGIYQDASLIDETNSCEVALDVDPHIVAYRIDGPLFFGAAERFVKTTTAHPKINFLILRMRRVPIIDTTGILALLSIHKQLERQGCQLLLSGLQDNVKEKIKATGAWEEIGEQNIFDWTRDAKIAAQERLSNKHQVIIRNELRTS